MKDLLQSAIDKNYSEKKTEAHSHSQEITPDLTPVAHIKVVGVGGGGGNAINRMVNSDFANVDFISVNTDAQALYHSKAENKVHLGRDATRGLGAGADPVTGKLAAEESLDELKSSRNASKATTEAFRGINIQKLQEDF